MSIILKNINKSFGTPPTHVLHDINLTINDGEFVALTGRSGSGKSTLLYILSTLDFQTSGSILMDGQEVSKMDSESIHKFRNLNMGFVFQFHHLIPELTAIENVLMPAIKTKQEIKLRGYAESLLNEFGLKGKADRFPSQLSGGEQQRVAVARALIMSPKYLFADEPTGNLDSVSGTVVMKLFQKINLEKKTTVVFVTHDANYASLAHRQFVLVDGKI